MSRSIEAIGWGSRRSLRVRPWDEADRWSSFGKIHSGNHGMRLWMDLQEKAGMFSRGENGAERVLSPRFERTDGRLFSKSSPELHD